MFLPEAKFPSADKKASEAATGEQNFVSAGAEDSSIEAKKNPVAPAGEQKFVSAGGEVAGEALSNLERREPVWLVASLASRNAGVFLLSEEFPFPFLRQKSVLKPLDEEAPEKSFLLPELSCADTLLPNLLLAW